MKKTEEETITKKKLAEKKIHPEKCSSSAGKFVYFICMEKKNRRDLLESFGFLFAQDFQFVFATTVENQAQQILSFKSHVDGITE